ncbi:MAG: protein translocase subunit SecF [Clostridiales bacterium]|nr:protein translocase subunit SecF [Clostridiales bacterium]
MKLREKFDNLMENDFHIAEKRKLIFIIPLVILVIAAIMMIVFRFTVGSAFNLGTDFTGGYSVDVTLGNKLSNSNKQAYFDQIEEVFAAVTAENGKTYKVEISGAMQMQGTGSEKASIHVKYSQVRGVSENEMSKYVNPAIVSALEEKVLNKVPNIKINGRTITATYDEVINNDGENSPFASIRDAFIKSLPEINKKGKTEITVAESAFTINPENRKQIIIESSTDFKNSAALRSAIVSAMNLPDKFSGSVTGGDMVGATVSTELLFTAIIAVALALMFMLSYIGLRFQISSGLACIIALFHDILIMFAFMAICHIEINSTFIAALITILGYSINNSIIIFDRVRENMRSLNAKSMTPEAIANKSVKDTLLRSINTTITTLIMIAMVAIIGVSDIRIFAFPIIIGLLSGTYSSICIAPSLWALFQRVGRKNRANFNLPPVDKKRKQKQKTSKPSEIGA